MRHVRLSSVVAWAAALAGAGAAFGDEAGPANVARLIRAGAGLPGEPAVCVHVGCGDGRLTAELARGTGTLVQGLSTDQAEAETARRYIREQRLYGQVSVIATNLKEALPYADNLVNLVVVDDLPARLKAGLMLSEVMRVLCPGGAAMLDKAPAGEVKAALATGGDRASQAVDAGEGWVKVVKARPAGMDEWTHGRRDAASTAVSTDTLAAIPVGLRWMAGPAWPMGFHKASFSRLLSAGGRNFYVTFTDFANISRIVEERPKHWQLVARDAWNGALLWRRPVNLVRGGPGPVAVGQRVYLAEADGAVALDAANGKVVTTYAKAPKPVTELLYQDGTLLLAGQYGSTLTALDPGSGAVKWTAAQTAGPLVADGKVFFCDSRTQKLSCLDFATGKGLWQSDVSQWIKAREDVLLFVKGGVAVFQNSRSGDVHVFSGGDGKHLWSYPTSPEAWKPSRGYVFHNGRELWVMYVSTKARSNADNEVTLEGFEPLTGKSLKRYVIKPGRVGNCGTTPVASERFFMFVRPLKFVDWVTGRLEKYQGARGTCSGYITPANGLVYNQPIDCGCFTGMLRGFMGMAPAGPPTIEDDESTRLEKGPAYADAARGQAPGADEKSSWAVFGHDAARGGAAGAPVPAEVKPLWSVRLANESVPPRLEEDWASAPLGGDPLTQPTAGDGKVFVSLPLSHQVAAVDAAAGKVLWTFTAGGRLDTPPTLHGGLCLLGCRDGYVYCLRAEDGRLVWRFRAAPRDRRIMAFGQVESKWPVEGGVVVAGGRAIFAAGRGTEADGGMTAWALEPATGKVIWRASPGPVTEKGRTSRPIFRADLLVAGGTSVHMAYKGGWRLDAKTGKDAPGTFEGIHGGTVSTAAFLDRSWHWLETYNTARYQQRTFRGVTGHIVLFDAKRAYAFVKYEKSWVTNKPDRVAAISGKDLSAPAAEKGTWSLPVPEPRQVEAMIVAGEVLFAAGPNDRRDHAKGGFLWAVGAGDGRKLAELALDSPPAADGLSAAGGRLYLAAEDGTLHCLGAKD